MPIGIPFIHNFIYDTYKTYIIHYVNHIYVIRGHWQSKKGQKRGKKIWQTFENAPRDCILHNFLYDTYKTYRINYVNHIYAIRGHW